MPDTSITVDVKGWRRQVKDLARRYGVDMRVAMGEFMRQWGQDLVKTTWPPRARVGRGAVANDIHKVFIQLDQPMAIAFFQELFGNGVSSGGGVRGKRRQAKASAALPNVKFNWRGDEQQMKAWHLKHRGRDGHVKFRQRRVARRGKWEFGAGMYVPSTALRRYIRRAVRDSGVMKAGWVRGTEQVAQQGARIPAWVRKQAGKAPGSGANRMRPDGTGYAEIINRVEHGTRALEFFLKKTVMRRDALMRNHFEQHVKRLAKQWSAK